MLKTRLMVPGLLVVLASLGGCTTTRLYDGEPLAKEATAIFHSNGSSSGPFMAWKIDGKKKLFPSIFSPKAAFLAPGNHEIELSVFISRGMIPHGVMLANGEPPPRDFVFQRTYRFEAGLAAGYSYQIEYPGGSLSGQKFELCLYGEPHDAPGSSVSWGLESREMSAGAVKVQCRNPESVTTRDGKVLHPESFPASLVFQSP